MKICGVYKITSPSGRVYIGQSSDIERRWKDYGSVSRSKCQIKLFYSLQKYGVDKHKFEVLEECKFEELNIRERHYQDIYDVLGENGLNLRLTGTEINTPKFSEEILEKIRKAAIGRVQSEETRKKISQGMKGMKRSQATINKMRIAKKGNQTMLGKKHSEETKRKMSISQKGKSKPGRPKKIKNEQDI